MSLTNAVKGINCLVASQNTHRVQNFFSVWTLMLFQSKHICKNILFVHIILLFSFSPVHFLVCFGFCNWKPDMNFKISISSLIYCRNAISSWIRICRLKEEISGGESVQNFENKGCHIDLEYVIMKLLNKNRLDNVWSAWGHLRVSNVVQYTTQDCKTVLCKSAYFTAVLFWF